MTKNIKDTKNYLIGSVVTKSLGFISIPFFTHYLSVEEFGVMSLYSTVLTFLTTLLGLGILGSFKRYYFEKDNNFGSFLFSNMLFLFTSSFIFSIFYFIFLANIANFIDIPTEVLKYAFFVAFLLLIIRIKLDFLQIRQHSKKNAVFEFIQTFMGITISIVFVLMLSEDKYMGKVYGDLIAYILYI